MKNYSSQLSIKRKKTKFEVKKISSAKDAYDYVKNFYFDDISIYESVFILILDQANNTKAFAKISQGGVSSAIVDIKLIAYYAISELGCNIILVHNHPSGQLNPSNADDSLTEKTKKALELLDVKLLDHLIITENDFYSYQENFKLS